MALDGEGDLYVTTCNYEEAESVNNSCLERAKEFGLTEIVLEATMDLAELYATWADLRMLDGTGCGMHYNPDMAQKAFSSTSRALELSVGAINEPGYNYRGYRNLSLISYISDDLIPAFEYGGAALNIAEANFLERSVMLLIARIQRRLGNMEYASHHQAEFVSWAESIKDIDYMMQGYHELGVTNLMAGKYEDSGELLKKALALNSTVSNKRIAPELECALGELAQATGRTSEALSHFRRSASYSERFSEDALDGQVDLAVGRLLYEREEFPRALQFFDRAISSNDLSNDDESDARILLKEVCFAVGADYKQAGEYKKALEMFSKSELLNAEVADTNLACRIGTNKADISKYHGDYEEAESVYLHVLSATTEATDIWFRTMTGLLDNRYRRVMSILRSGDQELSEQLLAGTEDIGRRTLELAREKGNTRTEVETLVVLGNLYSLKRELERARESFERAIEVASANFLGKSAYCNLGELYRQSDRPAEAVEAYERYLDYAKGILDKRLQAIALNNLGVASIDLGDYQKAIDYLNESIDLAKQTGSKACQILSLIWKGEAYLREGDEKLAIGYLRESMVIGGYRGGLESPPDVLKETALELSSRGEFKKAAWFLGLIKEKYLDYYKDHDLEHLMANLNTD